MNPIDILKIYKPALHRLMTEEYSPTPYECWGCPFSEQMQNPDPYDRTPLYQCSLLNRELSKPACTIGDWQKAAQEELKNTIDQTVFAHKECDQLYVRLTEELIKSDENETVAQVRDRALKDSDSYVRSGDFQKYLRWLKERKG